MSVNAASYGALVDLLESIERFLRRLDIYTQIPHTPTLDEMVVRIMVELLSTLALAIEKLKQGPLSESVLVEILSNSAQSRNFFKAMLWTERLRGSIAEARPAHAR